MQRSGSTAHDWASLPARGGRRVALEDAVRDAIRSGRLKAGDPLPSTRALAVDLGLARGTVAEAYAQLAAEGYLSARPGGTTRVAAGTAAADAIAEAETTAAEPRFTLAVGVPDVTAFPRTAWTAAMRRALRTAPSPVFA